MIRHELAVYKGGIESNAVMIQWRTVMTETHRILRALQDELTAISAQPGRGHDTLEKLMSLNEAVNKLACTTSQDGYFDYIEAYGEQRVDANDAYEAYVASLRDGVLTQLAALATHSPQCALLETFMTQKYTRSTAEGLDDEALLFYSSENFAISDHDYKRLMVWRGLWQSAVSAASKNIRCGHRLEVLAARATGTEGAVRALSDSTSKWLLDLSNAKCLDPSDAKSLDRKQKHVQAKLALALDAMVDTINKTVGIP